MSYEGFERALCRNGHLHTADCYSSNFLAQQWDSPGTPAWSCPDCGEPMAWWESVDQTNDGGVQTALLEHREAELKTCGECGVTKQLKPPQYCCPENRRARDPQPLVPIGQRGYEVLETREVFDTVVAAAERLQELREARERVRRMLE